jgi:uncharacterized peroxidase-related enzyme
MVMRCLPALLQWLLNRVETGFGEPLPGTRDDVGEGATGSGAEAPASSRTTIALGTRSGSAQWIMAYLPSLPDHAVLLDVFRAYPQTARPLLAYHQALLRGPSPLTVAERELIAAYVSGVNACGYCHGVHQATAQAFGIGEGTLAALLTDVDTAPIPERMKPLLRYVGKLTVAPAKVAPAEAEAVLSAGWEEQAMYDAVAVCGLFNLMNRLVEGLGITAGEEYFVTAARRLAGEGYSGLADLLE